MTFFLLLFLNCHIYGLFVLFLLYSERPDMLQLVRHERGGGGKGETREQSSRHGRPQGGGGKTGIFPPWKFGL